MLKYLRPCRWLFVVGLFCTDMATSFAEEAMISDFPTNEWTNAFCGLNFTVLDNSCTPSSEFSFNINGVSGDQLGQNVRLQEVRIILAHNWVADMDIRLFSPSGKEVELSTDNGGGGDHYGNPDDTSCSAYTAFTMNACQSIEDGFPPFIGNYLPEGDLNEFNDNSNPNGQWTLQLCDDAPNDIGTLKYIELIFSDNLCTIPADLAVDSIDGNSAFLSWTSSSNCNSTILEYGIPGFVPGTDGTAGEGTILNVVCSPNNRFELSSLNELTDYEVYIREQCDAFSFSENACSINFSTGCQTPDLTIVDDFDDQNNCATSCGTVCPLIGTWSNVTSDDQDWLLDKNGTTSTNTGPSDDVSGGGAYLYIEASGGNCQNNKEFILQSECILVNAENGSCHFSFYYHMFGVHINQLVFQISLNGGNSWIQLWSESGDQGEEWKQKYINLNAYDGQVALFRFVGFTGTGFRGDIGLDQIEFYGSERLGETNNTFYADLDQDGYGDANNSLSICADNAPSNYVNNALDCDDSNFSIRPFASEVPCNFIDENCNGDADDQVLEVLTVNGATICRGEQTSLSINANPTGAYHWYSDPAASNLLFVGNSFNTGILESATTFYVKDSVQNACASALASVVVDVFIQPNIFSPSEPSICEGATYDLSNFNIIDEAMTSGTLSFHTSSPTTSFNELSSLEVEPTNTQNYFARWETENGCYDEVEIFVEVTPKPSINFLPSATVEVCATDVVDVSIDSPMGTSYIYEWDNNDPNPDRAIRGANPGNQSIYALTVTDEIGCTSQELLTINTLPSINSVAVVGVEDVTFCGGNDGSIALQPLNGVSPFHYEWSGPVSGSITNFTNDFELPNLPQGSYRITITDNTPFGCELVLPAFIINGPSAVIDTVTQITAVDCPGAANGHIDITVTGNAPTYIWSNGATTQDLEGVTTGTYAVTIQDGICTNVLENLIIPEPDPIEFFPALFQHVSCVNGQDGAIEISLNGGTPPYEFIWSNGASGKSIDNLAAGSYEVTVTDSNNCIEVTNALMIDEPSNLNIESTELIAATCNGWSDGQIMIGVNGGVAPYFYQWSNGVQTKDLQNVPSGNYQLTVTDANDCTMISPDYNIGEPNVLMIEEMTIEPTSCEGISDGSIDIRVTGGTTPYEFIWSNNETDENIDSLAVGIYHLTIEDHAGCVLYSPDFEITAPTVLTITNELLQPQSCVGVADGMIDITLDGGTTPYLYNWSNGEQSEMLNSLESGDYQLTVTDDQGCIVITPMYNLDVIASQATEIDLVDPVTCNGESNGRIFIDPPGVGPFSYEWNNGSVTEDLQNLPSGEYTLTMTDAEGCLYFLDTILIAEPAPLDIQLTAAENVSCHGTMDGSIEVSVEGGKAPYSFTWNNGQSTEDLTNIPAGTYQLTLLDANACIIDGPEITIVEPESIELLTTNIVNVGCSGNSSGSIAIEVSGGVLPYEYLWSNGSFDKNINSLDPGKYDVTVSDANACTAVLMAVEVQQLIENLTVVPHLDGELSCFNSTEGALSIEILGGSGPYQYNWSNGVLDSVNIHLPQGQYNVTVTDINGCIGVSPWVFLEEPTDLVFEVMAIEGVDCFGEENGRIEMEVAGGTTPYFYQWSNGAITQDIQNLPAGNYYVTITDANNCQEIATQPLTISQPLNSLGIQSVDLINGINCELGTGSIALEVEGGTPPFTYQWSNGGTENGVDNLSTGNYQCTVTDAKSCTFVTNAYTIEAPSDLQLNTISTPSIDNMNNGTATVEIIGGVWPFTFSWDEATGYQQDSIALSLPSGEYEVLVTDAQGCEFMTTVEVDMLTVVENIDDASFKIYPNPTNNKVFLSNIRADIQDFQVEIFSIAGQLLQTTKRDVVGDNTPVFNFQDYPSGVYLLKVTFNQNEVYISRLIVNH